MGISGLKRLWWLAVGVPAQFHFFGALAIVLSGSVVIASQMGDRRSFADSELHQDVMERWGAPIRQPSPSVRAVPSGTVFSTLTPLTLQRQEVSVDATMNYRKRGLVYFSGFDFAFRGDYRALNDEPGDLDVVFVFPIEIEKNKTLLSDLEFSINGKPAQASLTDADKLVWTGRVKSREQVDFHVGFRGRGLESFTYVLDPAAPVRQFHLGVHIAGGATFDYQEGVVSAGETRSQGNESWLDWRYPALESGIPVGVILPSEKSFDRLIATMLRRAWAPFLLLFGGVVALSLLLRRPLQYFESYLLAAGYELFFVLLAYLGAFLNFYVAWTLSLSLVGGLLWIYLRTVLTRVAGPRLALLLAGTLFTPTAGVLLEGYTGLIYTLQIAALLAGLMYVTTRDTFRARLAEAFQPLVTVEVSHA